MKQIICAFTASLITSFCIAQDGTIEIEQDKGISALMEIYKTNHENSNFYTIQVGSSNSSKADLLKMKVDIDFPGWHSEIKFESPSFRVRIGRFKTKLEAERKLIEVKKKYPNAFFIKPQKTTK